MAGYGVNENDLDRMEASGEKTFLLSVSAAPAMDRAVMRYLDFGEATGVPEGYLASHRPKWYVLEFQEAAPILFTYMTRIRPRFLLNTSGAPCLNNLIGLHPKKKLS